jgi:hypothetical protein
VTHVLSVQHLIPTTSANVAQDTLNQSEPAKHAQPDVTTAKSTVSAQLVQILKEDSTKTVTALQVSSMMVLPHAKLATHSARPVPTHQLVPHASPRTTEASPTDNVSVHQDSIKSSKPTTLSFAENAALNVKNAADQIFV